MPGLFLVSPKPQPRILNPETGWARPRIYKRAGKWVSEIKAYLYHGDEITVTGVHEQLDWSWILMVDHLVRHDVRATLELTQGPSDETAVS